MKNYVTVELKFVRIDEDIVTASQIVDGYDTNEGDLVTPNVSFWN